MTKLDDAVAAEIKRIKDTKATIKAIKFYEPIFNDICTAVGRDCDAVDYWPWANQLYINFTIPVHATIPEAVSPLLETLDAVGIVSINEWTSADDPTAKTRKFVYDSSDDKIFLVISAVLADDSACRIEVIGYEEQEVSEYVTTKRQVPITKLICPE